MQQYFANWLEQNKPKSARHYTSGYNTIDNILKEHNLNVLNTWNSQNYDENYAKLLTIESFQKLNSTGNNILTATLSNYKKFMERENYTIPPVKPFDNFKWRWAVTTPSEGINSPEIIIGVLKILNKHNGSKHATQEFQDELLSLQNSINTNIDLAKVDRGLHKNIIENSGQYWKALGLINNTTGGQIDVTDLGVSLAEEEITNNEFIENLYSNFKLPNVNIESDSTIQEWRENNVEVYPIKLIIDILLTLKNTIKSPASWFISPEELKKIIIPLSIYKGLPLDRYVNEILGFRKFPKNYNSWPDCTPGDNDFRMIKEYLIFLYNFGFLDYIELKDKSKRFYINSKTLEVFDGEIEDVVKVHQEEVTQINFDFDSFYSATENSGLIFSDKLIKRFIASLWTKPFVICSGLSGSGKTKLAQAFAMWICQDQSQYEIVPVGADWTNREPLLGYPNALKNIEYVAPENGVLQLILRAKQNENLPFFLILDEMNLSHVERYFADFLSAMESGEGIPLHKITEATLDIPQILSLPKNLFIIGTVNIDETTYMFSPKVLDRANTIEFRLTEDNLKDFIDSDIPLDLSKLEKEGASMAENFTKIAKDSMVTNLGDYKNELAEFFGELKKSGAEFGYRTTSEIGKLMSHLEALGEDGDVLLDIAIMQKLLPKLHGSRTKLSKTLIALGGFCLKDNKEIKDNYFTPFTNNEKTEEDLNNDANVKYKVSFEKICRMYKNAIENGFASYAEA